MITNGEITVSSRGISNGLSLYTNDGADFGPDTTLGTTTGATGAPYTQTCGIQESIDYSLNNISQFNPLVGSNGAYMIPIIKLLTGLFKINRQILISPSHPIGNIKIIGNGSMSTYVESNVDGPAILIDHTTPNIRYINIEIGYMQPYISSTSPSATFFGAYYVPGDPSYQTNVFQSYDIDISNGFNGPAGIDISGFNAMIAINIQAYGGGIYGSIRAINTLSIYISSPVIGNALYLSGYQAAYLPLISTLPNGNPTIWLSGNNTYIGIAVNINTIHMLGGGGNIYINNIQMSSGSSVITENTGGINTLHINLLTLSTVYSLQDLTSTGSYGSIIIDERIGIGNGIPGFPDTINGTTSGSFTANQIESTRYYKKIIIILNAYENDSTTAQIYSFPLPFNTVAEITSNSASVPGVSTSLSTFSIAPDTTTTYTGIIIIEGY